MKKTIAQLLILLLPLMGLAQQYSVNWYKIAGGGGTSTNGQYSLSGTIGQPDAGLVMSGGNYSITGGFWSIIAVIPTPGAPMVYINQSGGIVTVSWQAVAGWSLYQNSTLSTASWSTSSGVTTANGTNYLTLSHPSGNLFFRLHNP